MNDRDKIRKSLAEKSSEWLEEYRTMKESDASYHRGRISKLNDLARKYRRLSGECYARREDAKAEFYRAVAEDAEAAVDQEVVSRDLFEDSARLAREILRTRRDDTKAKEPEPTEELIFSGDYLTGIRIEPKSNQGSESVQSKLKTIIRLAEEIPDPVPHLGNPAADMARLYSIRENAKLLLERYEEKPDGE